MREYFYGLLKFEPATDLPSLLQQHDFLLPDNDNCCSYFAYALFARKPGTRLPHSEVRFTVYEGTDKDYDSLFDTVFNRPWLEYRGEINDRNHPVEEALHHHPYFQSYLSREELINLVRRRIWDYPPEAVREAIINALAHRDWTKQDMVRIVAYSDRLEVISPGALPNGLTVDGVVNGSLSHRNQKITRIFRDYGYMEQQGMGIRRKLIPLMLKHNGVEPIFQATEDYFKVVLPKKLASK